MSENPVKDKLLIREREKYGKWTDNSCSIDKPRYWDYKPVETDDDIHHLRNAMATGNYPLDMPDCFVVGINGDCGEKCPVFLRGECSSPEGI